MAIDHSPVAGTWQTDWCTGGHWPTFRFLVACANYNNTWTSYWGPDIICGYGASELVPANPARTQATAPFRNGTTMVKAIVQCYQNLKCVLKSVNPSSSSNGSSGSNAQSGIRWTDALYECSPWSAFGTGDSSSSSSTGSNGRVKDCLANFNSTVLARNIVRPVSELLLKLPKLSLELMATSAAPSNGSELPCALRGIGAGSSPRVNLHRYQLVCNNSAGRFTFYENDSFDLLTNSTSAALLEPVQCLMNVEYEYGTLVDQLASMVFLNGTVPGPLMAPAGLGPKYEWSFLFVILFIFAGGLGNILVCLAVALDRKLQNVTNYFLLSLAIADLLVSLFVMPLGAIPGFLDFLR